MLVNPMNVVLILYGIFSIGNLTNKAVNIYERELSSQLEQIIRDASTSSLVIDNFDTLDYEEKVCFTF